MQNADLTELFVKGCSLGDGGVLRIFQATELSGAQLLKFAIGDNDANFGASVVLAVTAALINFLNCQRSLKVLDLGLSYIDEEVMPEIAPALPSGLEHLELDEQSLDLVDALSLVASRIERRAVIVLTGMDNEIPVEAATAITQAFQAKSSRLLLSSRLLGTISLISEVAHSNRDGHMTRSLCYEEETGKGRRRTRSKEVVSFKD